MIFGKKAAEKTANLPAIIVRQSALDGKKDYDLPAAVVYFVNYTLHQAQYERAELPQEAMQAFHVDYYIAQVNNGGHSQYVGNSGWHQYQIDDIKAGLAAIGNVDAIDLYADLCAFADSNPEQFREGMEARGFGDFPDFFEKADKVFYAGLNDQLMRANSDWIRSLDCLMPVPDAQFAKMMEGLSARNPNFEQRKADREQAAKDALLQDPIFQACQFLGGMADTPMQVTRWLNGSPTRGPKGVQGTVFQVELTSGETASIFIFPQFGVMVGPDVEKRNVPIPMEMIQSHVKGTTGEYLPAGLWQEAA